jgi:hypothetical protein
MTRKPQRTASLVGAAFGAIVVATALLLVAGCGGDDPADPIGLWQVTYQDTADTCDDSLDQFSETWKIRHSGGTLCISTWDSIKGCVEEFCAGRYSDGTWTYQGTVSNVTDPGCTETINAAFNLEFTEATFAGTYTATAHYTGTCPDDCGRQRTVTGVLCATDCWAETGCP